MRDAAFYWKCDCPGSAAAKKGVYFSNKHTAESDAIALSIAADFLGAQPFSFQGLKAAGNHFAYVFSGTGGKYLLRTDDGLTDDDYIAAESAVIDLLVQKQFPVAAVFKTISEAEKFPVRFQILEFINHPTLQDLSRNNNLDAAAIAAQFGHYLAKLHDIKLPGFGFIDTRELQATGQLRGRDATWGDYFHKCLDTHLAYLQDNAFLAPGLVRRIANIFAQRRQLLNINKGSLLHRDFAYWNILGVPTEIKAVIDWDDAVVGDPADDLGIVNCFHSAEFMENLLAVYSLSHPLDDTFRLKIHFYTLRNMLWKAMLRHYMGYFDQEEGFFLNKNDSGLNLKDFTLLKITDSVTQLERI